jgi:hypothetical protein
VLHSQGRTAELLLPPAASGPINNYVGLQAAGGREEQAECLPELALSVGARLSQRIGPVSVVSFTQ